jgi:hypothetical protein
VAAVTARQLGRLPEPYRKLAQAARLAGWRIERTARHLAWISPAGQRVITPATPGDRRSPHKARASLRRAGLVTSPHPRKPRSASGASGAAA